jgi:hypothetical protein
MNKQILAAVVVVAGLGLGGVAQAQTAASLTPEQLKTKATLEKVFSCQQKAKAADVIKLLESFPGVSKDKPLTVGDKVDKRPFYKLQTPLKLWNVDTYRVSVGKDDASYHTADVHAIYESERKVIDPVTDPIVYNNFVKKAKFKQLTLENGAVVEGEEPYLPIKVGGKKIATASLTENYYDRENKVFIVECGWNVD